MSFRLSDYDYSLPESLIAQRPATPRDSSRLLVLDRKTGKITHRVFREISDYLDSNDVLVVNNTRVFRARLLGHRLKLENGNWVEGGKVQFFMLKQLDDRVWEGLFHASARYVPGLRFQIPTADGRGVVGELIRGVSESEHGTVVAQFDRDPIELKAGHIPLPQYIKREDVSADEESYQTIYAKSPTSAAAPTAGLHFTDQLVSQLKAKGVSWEEITLDVGLGTFRPVKSEDIREHKMHEERFELSEPTAARLARAKTLGKRIVAVGTTSVRTLESAWQGSSFRPGAQKTSLFIHPGVSPEPFRVVDRLITNFHLPRSSLLMLVCAFAGKELVLEAYNEAVREKYRFFSYGDSMLIL